MNSPGPLILASTSRYRRELLARLGTQFEVVDPRVAEDHRASESPADRALRLATLKAQAVAARRPDALVVGSDQVAACAGQVLDKPGDAPGCRAQLAALSDHTAQFYTACVLLGSRPALHAAHIDTTTAVFRALSAQEIARYVEREQPFDCAGGFKSEGLGVALFEYIESQDPTALIGLPLIWLAGALRAAGYHLP
jgi:septum formation protein